MKIDRHGKAKILTQSEIQLLLSSGLRLDRARALFGICLFSACRIMEACSLLTIDVYNQRGEVRPTMIIRFANTKGKLATRTIHVIDDLRRLLINYKPSPDRHYLFPGRVKGQHIDVDSAARILRNAFKKVGIEGSSTHSFRRTALTMMSDSGIPLRVIQAISGHRSLEQLQEYLEVRDEQVKGALSTPSLKIRLNLRHRFWRTLCLWGNQTP